MKKPGPAMIRGAPGQCRNGAIVTAVRLHKSDNFWGRVLEARWGPWWEIAEESPDPRGNLVKFHPDQFLFPLEDLPPEQEEEAKEAEKPLTVEG